eukprot:scaffold5605_cov128-Cylindrotheca_fusiformis.AAC.22
MGFKKLFTGRRKAVVAAVVDDDIPSSTIPVPTRGSKNKDRAAKRSTDIHGISPAMEAESHNIATRKIRYHDQVQVYEYPAGYDFEDEFGAGASIMWLTHRESSRIRRREKRLSRKLYIEGSVGPEDDATGLDTKEGMESKMLFIGSSVRSVLGEQARQFDQNEYDPDRIAWIPEKAMQSKAQSRPGGLLISGRK